MSRMPVTTTVVDTTVPATQVYDFVSLFRTVLDQSKPSTKACLRYISDPDTNGDTVTYVCIWLSLASTFNDYTNQYDTDLYLPEPGMPLFMIDTGTKGIYKTHMFWYEIVYRSIRVVDEQYTLFRKWYNECTNTHNLWPVVAGSNTPMYYDAAPGSHGPLDTIGQVIGAHRIVGLAVEQLLHDLVDVDMGYTTALCDYDIKRMQMIYAFMLGLKQISFNDIVFARFFKTARDLYTSLNIDTKHKEDALPDFINICNRCIHVYLARHHLTTNKKRYALIQKHLVLAVNMYKWLDPLDEVTKVTLLKANSVLPQEAEASSQECEKEITLLNNEDIIINTYLLGKDIFKDYPFVVPTPQPVYTGPVKPSIPLSSGQGSGSGSIPQAGVSK